MKLVLGLAMIILMMGSAQAKAPGKFTKYYQVTDKEILIESNKGIKVLFTAYNNNSIGVSYYNKADEARLTSPSNIIERTELMGSIYVEELDELMQITTTSNDGMIIKINKDKFGFTFIDKKSNNEIVLEEEVIEGMAKNHLQVCFIVDNNSFNHLMAEAIE